MQNVSILTNEEINRLLVKYPALEIILKFKGTVVEFYNLFTNNFSALSDYRKARIIDCICYSCKNLFSTIDISLIKNSLNENYMVSTAEHHASITYPETFNVVLNHFLIQSVHKLPIISLSCSTTTLDNELFPRGVFYKYQKIPFLSSSYRGLFVSNAPPINPKVFEEKIKSILKNKVINNEEAIKISTWFENEYNYLKNFNLLSEQISIINKHLFKSIMDEDLHYPNFNYYMIPSERVTYYMLLEDFNSESPSWVFNSIFNFNLRIKLLEALNGVRLCWDVGSGKGTFLFWGYLENRKPVRLFLDGNYLSSACKSIYISLEPEIILESIKKNIITPSSNLFFLYSVFYAGITTLGGILQINYLTDMKKKIIENNPLELSVDDLKIIQSTPTNIYVNFQKLEFNEGGIERLWNKFSALDLEKYKSYNHFDQIQECLCYLSRLD